MKQTPTMKEALAEAIEILEGVSGGRQYSADELREPIARFADALNDQRIAEIQDARRREQIRNLSHEVRESR